MNRRIEKEQGIGPMVACSLLLHAFLLGIIYGFNLFSSPHPPVSQAYYVDIVNLPVAHPQSGTPSAPERTASAAASPQRQEMKLPAPAKKKSETSSTTPSTQKTKKEVHPDDSDEYLNKRMAKFERNAESRHETSAIDAIRKRLSTSGRAGMPGGKGNQSGSDYASYIQSRLKDAFQDTMASQSSNPEVAIKLRISKFGKVIGYTVVHSSRDKTFEASVSRAISIAGENFPPPPNGSIFEHGYIFHREGVMKR